MALCPPAERGRDGVRILLAFRTVDSHSRARQLIDQAHAGDPVRAPDGRPAELVYADRMEAWVARLVPDASPALQARRPRPAPRTLAGARAAPFPRARPATSRGGARSTPSRRNAPAASCSRRAWTDAAAADVATWVSKTGLKANPGTQALEDAACLVFLENEIGAFAAQHADYPREKFVEILRKTWRKMSPAAQQAALALDLPPAIAGLVREAVGGDTPPR
jgi:hypothetical protein